MLSSGNVLNLELPSLESVVPEEGANHHDFQSRQTWNRSLAEVDKEHIQRVLIGCGNNYGKACKILGITRPTLRKKIAEYGIVIVS